MYRKDLIPVKEDGTLVTFISAVLKLFKIDPDRPLETLIPELLNLFVTPATPLWKERALEKELDFDQIAQFWALVKPTVLYQPLYPMTTSYKYAATLGGLLAPQDRKNAHLCEVLVGSTGHDPVTVEHLVHMTAVDRLLETDRETIELLLHTRPGGLSVRGDARRPMADSYHNETDLVRELWERSQLPPVVEALNPPDYVAGVDIENNARANTVHCCYSWISDFGPEPGTIFGVSISPFGPAQYWDLVFALESLGFTVDIAAPTAELGPQRVDYFTRALAFWLARYYRQITGIDLEIRHRLLAKSTA